MSKTSEDLAQAAAHIGLFIATSTGGSPVSAQEISNVEKAQTVIDEQKVEVKNEVEQPAVVQQPK